MIIVIGHLPQDYENLPDVIQCKTTVKAPLPGSIDWCLINLDNNRDVLRTVKQIRQTERLRLLPLYLRQCTIEFPEGLIDGYDLGFANEKSLALSINTKLGVIHEGIDSDDDEQCLLGYLHSRQEIALAPVVDATSAQLARYPLAEYFIKDKHLALKRVEDLAGRGLLESKDIWDEIQCCPHCHNAWITYRNTCPECHSLDIKKTRFLHCFRCGNTEPEFDFLRKNILICPRCNTKLRHIGVDYDRPLEEYLCRTNQHQFSDTAVIARCLSCNQDIDPVDLVSKKICVYRLSKKGHNYLSSQSGLLDIDLQDDAGFCEPAYFSLFLDWMIKACVRHQELSFSLVRISIVNSSDIISHYGAVKTRQMYNEFFNYLKNVLRSTDLGKREADGSITLLLTQSRSTQITHIKKNISGFINEYKKTGLMAMRLRFDALSSDQIQLKKYDAQLLLSELSARSAHD